MRRCPACHASYQGAPERCPIDGAELELEPDARLGQEIGGWQLRELLACGALASVYRAERGALAGALKLYCGAALELLRASREGSAHARLDSGPRVEDAAAGRPNSGPRVADAAAGRPNCPRIAALLDHGTTAAGEIFLVTELVAGPTLRATLDERRTLPVGEALLLGAQVCDGLDPIHQAGLVHRDLKPENLILEPGPTGPRIKILDLGHALLLDLERLTQSGMVWGSAAYMSPEQAAALPVDARSDLYSLGVILYEMLVGRRPFEAPAAVDIMQMHRSAIPAAPAQLAAVPAQVSDLCLWLLSKQPRQRPPSARVVRAVLQSLQGDERGERFQGASAPA
jgi:serine/threonine-protein kinase